MEIYTEDKASVTSSILLRKMVAVNFLGGNGNIRSILNTGKEITVFVDAVPDNGDIRDLYTQLKENAYGNITIIPIPCVEYNIIKLLVDLDINMGMQYSWLQTVLDNILLGKSITKYFPPRKIGYKESFNSFEKQCKLFLNNCNIRFVNFDTEDLKVEAFDDSWYLSGSDNLSVLTKSALLWLKFPCVEISDNRLVVCGDKVRRYVKLYESWLYSNCKIKLPDKRWE